MLRQVFANLIERPDGKLDDKGKPMEIGLRVGETIYYGKYSGTDVEIDGEKLVILRESDVLGVLE